jgi:hypothetical protein
MTITLDQTGYNTIWNRIKRIYEAGDGDYGYGQQLTSIELGAGAAAEQARFTELRADILAARYHQIGVQSIAPIPATQSIISASDWAKWETTLIQVENNRLLTPPSTQAIRDNLAAPSIMDSWNGLTTFTADVTFDSADAMRHYFNTGSTIEFTSARTGGISSKKNTSWSSFLTTCGIVSFKRSSTTSTKTSGTSIGYGQLTDSDQVIYQKTVTDAFKPDSYTIKARLSEETVISFTIEFNDIITGATDANVDGVLTTTINAYHAAGIYVSVPAPIASADTLPGDPNPVFTIARDVSRIDEGLSSVTFSVSAINFLGDIVHWRAVGPGINASDFVENTLGDSLLLVDGIGTFALTAAADNFTEGTEKFNIEIRVSSELTSPVVALMTSEQITDLSLTIPVVIVTPSYDFVAQTVSSVAEGQSVSYTIVTTGVPDGTELIWSTVVLTPGLTADDFDDKTLSGTVTINSNTATLTRTLVDDSAVEKLESYQISLSTVNPTTGIKKVVKTSYLMQIVDTVVVIPEIPYTVVTGTATTTVAEGSKAGIIFKINTPKLPVNTRVWWNTVVDTGTITASDFTDNAMSGSIVISNQTGSVTRYAKADSLTEGTEQFHLVFYADALMTTELVTSDIVVSINETVNYVITRNPVSMVEDGLGVVFTVNTPWMEDGTVLYWTTVSQSGTVDELDFADNTLSGTVTISGNTGTILRRAVRDTLTEGLEQFYLEIRATDGTGGPLLISSQSTTITENVLYEINTLGSEISEGLIGVDFVVTTPKLPAGTVLYWSTVTDTGTITASDFTDNKMSGTVVITNNTGTITRTAADDALTEGIESFHLILKTGSASGTQVCVSSIVTISEFVKYKITPSTQSVIEGQSGATFNITTPKVANGTVVYWTALGHTGNITGDDFVVSDAQGGSAQRTSGQVIIQNNRGSFIITARADSLTEGSESFQIELRSDGIDGPVLDTTGLVALNEIVPYQIIAGAATVAEGTGSVSFTVKTPVNAATFDGAELYWTTRTASGTIAASDFTDGLTQGTVTINGNVGTIIRTADADKLTEGVDAFSIELRLTGYGSPVLVTSNVVVIQDLSTTVVVPDPQEPVYTVTSDTNAILEGGSVVFTIATDYVLPTANLYWTLFRGPGLEITDLSSIQSPSAFHIDMNDGGAYDEATNHEGTAIVTVTAPVDVLSEGTESFIFQLRTGSLFGPVVATSPTAITVSDQASYAVSASVRSISEVEEGGAGVTFTVTTPQSAIGTALTWTIVPVTGTVTAADFVDESLTGTLSTNGTITRTFSVVAVADAATEGNESFRIALSDSNGPITLGTAAPVVTISEIVSYSLSSNVTSVTEGGSVVYTLSTPKLKADALLKWTVVSKTGNLTAADFTPQSLTGTFTASSSTNTGTFTVVTRADSATEGDESFTIDLSVAATGQSITLGTPCLPVTITETVSYIITPSATSVAEGSAVTFAIATPMLDDNTVLYWEVVSLSGPVNADDFVENKVNGPVTIVNNAGQVVVTLKDDKVTEGNETFKIQLREGSAQGSTIDASCATVTVAETVGYSVTSSASAVVEGGAVTFNITTPKVDDGTVIKWTAVSVTGSVVAGDFAPSGLTGTTTVTSNAATVTLTLAVDASVENTDTFTISLKKADDTAITLISPAPVITISDSSDYSVTANKASIVEGDATGVTFTVTTPGTSTEKSLYWSLESVSGNAIVTDFVAFTGTVTIVGHVGTVTVKAKSDTELAEGDSFRLILKTKSQTGIPVTISPNAVVTINDTEFCTITSDVTSIDEGGAGVTFTINTLTSDNGQKLFWKVVGSKGSTASSPASGINAADFTSMALTGQTSTVANKTTTVSFTAAADLQTDAGETFYLEVARSLNGTPIVFSTACPKITINDKSSTEKIVKKTIDITCTHSNAIAVGNNGLFEIVILPTGKAVDVEWEVAKSTPTAIQQAISLTKGGNLVSKGTIKTTWTEANPTVATGQLRLWINTLGTNASGSFQITFTVIDPVTQNPVIITSSAVNIIQPPVTETITSTIEWRPLVPGATSVFVSLQGGGGNGGGAGAAFDGGNGGDAGAVEGTIDIKSLKSLYFYFIAGGGSAEPLGNWTGLGGTGGSGIAVYTKKGASTPIASVGGAGGGGAGRVNGTAAGGTGTGPSVVFAWTATAAGTGITSKQANGGGGGGGSVAVVQPVGTYPANKNIAGTAVSRIGGTGGKSFVPENWNYVAAGGGLGGAGSKLITRQPKNGTYPKDELGAKNRVAITSQFLKYCIGPDDEIKHQKDTVYVTWFDIKSQVRVEKAAGQFIEVGQSLPEGDYWLNIYTDGIGAVFVGDKYYDGTKNTDYQVSLPAGWNNRISVYYQYAKANDNKTFGISATLRPFYQKSAKDTAFVWTTRSPGAMMKPQAGSGEAGTPAKAVLTYTPGSVIAGLRPVVVTSAPYTPPAYDVVTYPKYGSATISNQETNYGGLCYWEDLWIPIMTGTKLVHGCDDNGTFNFYNSGTLVWTTSSNTSLQTVAFPSSVYVITEIRVSYQDGSNHTGRGIYASIKTADSTVMWSSLDPAHHFRSPGATPAPKPPAAPNVNIVTYPSYTSAYGTWFVNGGNQALYAPSKTLYWEDLNIQVTSNMEWIGYSNAGLGSVTLYANNGSTQTIALDAANWSNWRPISSSLDVINKIVILDDWQLASGGIRSSPDVYVWTTRTPARHFK